MGEKIILELDKAEVDLLKAILDKVNIPSNLARTFVNLLEKMEKLECPSQPNVSKP